MGVKINITDLTFSENAYFFHVVDGETVRKRDVEMALREVSEGKVGKWLLSSLISNCKLLDVDVHVYCKP